MNRDTTCNLSNPSNLMAYSRGYVHNFRVKRFYRF